jgi:two-component system, cell cycle sensor histidine kinase and response regulator CckA
MTMTNASPENQTTMTLLLVDDRPDNLFVISELTNAHLPGCQVLTAANAQEGLEQAFAHSPDGILIDVQMPGMDGIEMCRRLKADQRTAHVPVILMTAHRSDPTLRAAGLDAGAEDFIAKPVDNVELVARIKVILRIKRAEDRLRQANAELEGIVAGRTSTLRRERDLAQSYLDVAGVMLLVLNADQTIALINKKGCEILGCTEAEAMGANWFDTFLPEAERAAGRSIHDGMMRGDGLHEYGENAVVDRAGRHRLVAWHNTVLLDDSGVIVGSLSSGEDITERRQMEEAVGAICTGGAAQFGERFFTTMITQLAGILEADCVLIGELAKKRDAPSVRTLSLWVDGQVAENLEYALAGAPCENVLAQGICSYPADVSSIFPEDHLLQEMKISGYVGVPLLDSQDRPLGLMVALFRRPIRNVQAKESILNMCACRTAGEIERRRTEEMLLQSSRLIALGQMAAGLAHELNQPLTGISVTAQQYRMLIERGREISVEGLLEDSDLILEQVDRMRRLIEHLRIFSRDRSAESKGDIHLGDEITNALKIAGAQLKSHGITLELELEEDLPPVLGDRYRMEQVLLNLINNSRDALDEKQEQIKGGGDANWVKRLRIDARCRDGNVVVVVEDTGPGISAENQQKLFQPFFTTKDPDKGTGLGLSISYAIVHDHGGALECESSEGNGALFRIVLPQRSDS